MTLYGYIVHYLRLEGKLKVRICGELRRFADPGTEEERPGRMNLATSGRLRDVTYLLFTGLSRP